MSINYLVDLNSFRSAPELNKSESKKIFWYRNNVFQIEYPSKVHLNRQSKCRNN